METFEEKIGEMTDRLQRIENALSLLVQQRTVKDWYSIEEASALLGKTPYTVREWARVGRIHADKKRSGRGKYCSWVVSHEEVERIQREGLLPFNRTG